MKHWTGARTWAEGVRKMAMEPTSDPVIAEEERRTDREDENGGMVI